MGNLELAMGNPALDAGSAGLLVEAMQAALQAAETSTTMLTFLGQTADTRAPVDLSQACRWTLPLLRASLPAGVRLLTDVTSPGPIVRAHADQIQQILINLITNAGEAVSTGDGVVHLAVSTVSPADIPEEHRFPVGWEPQNMAYACLEVTDTGLGIADEDIEKLFDPFFSDKDAGRGLGLSVVLGILRNHAGAVSVSSEPGRGSTFRVFLPLSVKETWSPPKKPAEFKAGGAVLVVDDEDRVRNVAASILRGLSFEVFEARDGAEAVEMLGEHRDGIRLVLCDLTMPGLSGWATLTALRKLVPGIPVILSSGYDRARVMAGSHPELPQTFLRKPYLSRDLGNAIRQALGAKATPSR